MKFVFAVLFIFAVMAENKVFAQGQGQGGGQMEGSGGGQMGGSGGIDATGNMGGSMGGMGGK
ncbi:glycine-rich RNA-binding protein GRP1A-like [Anoplophora glabripennis]|uniref:glycine-rich RNA-binding protein GRP1A-like n=1 Tax=Anoplophora glabripennis TaxID=217634 RepID=UPI000873CD11|nr:glycine-rich RNA-binding protein GRP1A-like [Anoplophora glabripennis]